MSDTDTPGDSRLSDPVISRILSDERKKGFVMASLEHDTNDDHMDLTSLYVTNPITGPTLIVTYPEHLVRWANDVKKRCNLQDKSVIVCDDRTPPNSDSNFRHHAVFVICTYRYLEANAKICDNYIQSTRYHMSYPEATALPSRKPTALNPRPNTSLQLDATNPQVPLYQCIWGRVTLAKAPEFHMNLFLYQAVLNFTTQSRLRVSKSPKLSLNAVLHSIFQNDSGTSKDTSFHRSTTAQEYDAVSGDCYYQHPCTGCVEEQACGMRHEPSIGMCRGDVHDGGHEAEP